MDWSEEGIDEEEQPALRRRPGRGRGAPSPLGGGPLPPPLPRGSGSRSPSPRRGGLTPALSRTLWLLRRPVSTAETRTGSSVRTTRRSPPPRKSGDGSPAGDDGREDTGADEIIAEIAEMREELATPAASPRRGGGGGADEEEEEPQVELDEGGAAPGFLPFSFQGIEDPPVVDGAEILDAFADCDEARKAKAAAEFLEATMGANTGPRTEALKTELVVNRRLFDLAGLERWMRTEEALSELEWFTGQYCDQNNETPQIELFECAFRALENAKARELHRGADARRRWIGRVGVPPFFFCPVSKKIMEYPVVIASGKTVDLAALEEWQKENGRICPVTGEVLAHTTFIPNVFLKLCIEHWRTANKIADAMAATDPPDISPDVELVFGQLTLMPHSPRSSNEVRNSLFLLHEVLIANESAMVHLMGSCPGTIAKLTCVLAETCLDPDPQLDDVIIRILEKVAFYGPNKAVFGDDRYAMPVLIARTLLGSVPMRARCAHVLGLLADDHYNKIKIGELGGFVPLVELLYVGDKGVKKTAARVIASLCEVQENQSKFMKEGVVDAIIPVLRNDGLVEEVRGILLRTADSYDVLEEAYLKIVAFNEQVCVNMAEFLWRTFVLMKREEDEHDVGSSMPASKKTWGEGSADQHTLGKQDKDDVKIIVSWLQKRCYFPRTYMYRED